MEVGVCSRNEEPCKRRRIMAPAAATPTRAIRAEHVFDLKSRFGQLLNDRATSDVIFDCKDGVRVFAHRALLMGSPVLKNMLYGEMKESQQREVSLPEISSAELLATFQILYTGQADLSWELAIGVLHAANFLLLPQLEDPVVRGMRDLISEVLDVGVVATNLSLALRPGLCLETKHQDLLQALVRFLEARYLSPEHVACLSQEALFCYLEGTQVSESDPLLSFSEYRKLRNVTLWCANQFSSDSFGEDPLIPQLPADEGILNDIVAEDKVIFFDHALNPAASDFATDRQMIFTRCREKLADLRLVEYLRLSAIHPKLLLRLIEPSGLFPATELLKAYRFQAITFVKGSYEVKEVDESDESESEDGEEDGEGGDDGEDGDESEEDSSE